MRPCGFNMDYMTVLIFLLAGRLSYGRFSVCHFENSMGCKDGFPSEDSSNEGWRLHKNILNSYVFASCQRNCVQQMTVMKGFQSMMLTKWTVNFCYFLSAIAGDVGNIQLRVLACGKNVSVPLVENGWQNGTVRFACMEPFSVGFEVHFDSALQRIALDQISVRDMYSKPTVTQCPTTIPSLFDLNPAIIEIPITPGAGADYQHNEAQTAVFGEEIESATESIPPVFTDDTYLTGNVSVQEPKKPLSSEKTTPTNNKPGQTLLNDMMTFFEDLLANPLLLAEVLAIATVAICCMTISIHCFIWRKQRTAYRREFEKSIRRQRYLARDLSNSDMLLDMNIHDSTDGDFVPISRSRSSSKATPPVDRVKLKSTKHATDRRATVSNGVPSSPDSSDEAKQRPHPRTKSVPNRPAGNYYETIDEVRQNALQPVVEGDGDDLKSRSLPTLVEDQSVTSNTKRSAKSCRDKGERRNRKQKKKSRKDSKDIAKARRVKVVKTAESVNDNTYENSSGTVTKADGHFYDKLGREEHNSDRLLDARVNAIKNRNERLSLNVENRKNSPKINKYRPRSLSQKMAEKEEWKPLGPSLSEQSTELKSGVSEEVDKDLDNDERPYFTLEPIGLQDQDDVNNEISSSELSDDMISGSLDTLQEQIIISKNHTDSFKRSINAAEHKTNRPGLVSGKSEESYTYETYEIGAQCHVGNAKQIETGDQDSCDPDEHIDKKNDFADRTYQTLEPPSDRTYQTLEPPSDYDGEVRRNKTSEETFF